MRKKSKPKKKTVKVDKISPVRPIEKGNVFDKILKENILEIRRPFAEELLEKPIKSMKPIPAKMQTTLEVESDDFSLVEYMDGTQEILHLEFELVLTDEMVYRVGEYHGVKQRKHELPIRHFVFHIGIGQKEIRTQLRPNEVYKGFTLVRANEKPPEEYLASDFPAIVIMAILGDYEEELKDKVIRSILTRLQELIPDERKLNKYIQQLLMLGRIRKLQPQIRKNVEIMRSFNFDITQDELYLEGAAKARAEAEKEAQIKIRAAKKEARAKVQEAKAKIKEVRAEVIQEARADDIAGIKEMLKDGLYSQKRISEILRVSISLVRKVKKELETEN